MKVFVRAGAVVVLIGGLAALAPRGPDRSASSLIVQGADAGSAAALVRAAGGTVTHELAIIDAVGAELTPRQTERLRALDARVRVYTDGVVRVAQAATTATRWVRDEFDPVSYGNNHGSQSWAAEWKETNDDGSPWQSEGVGIMDDGGSKRVRIAANGKGLWRMASLPSTATNASLSFKYRRANLESGDFVSVQASSDGGKSWKEVGKVQGSGNDGSYRSATYNLTPYRSSSTSVRFLATFKSNESKWTWPNDAVFVDDVQLTYDGFLPGTSYPVLAGVEELHAQGIDGTGVGVAVLDSGYWPHPHLDSGRAGWMRIMAQYDAVRNVVEASWGALPKSNDGSGHGTHVTSLIASRGQNAQSRFFGVAPNAQLVPVKAFDTQGAGRYVDVIRGIDWVVRNRETFNIRVLNCSFSATPRSHYWDDPLNQAVMRAWQAGIVVVASAGNRGPAPMTIGVPGNVPYVITVGAMSDNFTATSLSDDFLASFSSAGPTVEGFVKPDLIAPGGHAWGLMATSSRIAQQYPQFRNDGDSFSMSGTSQSAGVVSGVVALMMQKQWRTPDDVKCGLLATARPAVKSGGGRAYSVFQQGAGLVDAVEAALSTERGCANRGMDVALDLSGARHYGGPANRDAGGNYYLMGMSGSGYSWNGGYSRGSGYIWSDGYIWNDGYVWSDGYLWGDGYVWSDGYIWNDGYPWSDSLKESVAINVWVPQE